MFRPKSFSSYSHFAESAAYDLQTRLNDTQERLRMSEASVDSLEKFLNEIETELHEAHERIAEDEIVLQEWQSKSSFTPHVFHAMLLDTSIITLFNLSRFVRTPRRTRGKNPRARNADGRTRGRSK
jgi:hypothetical protein